jgi:hypothetical protein
LIRVSAQATTTLEWVSWQSSQMRDMCGVRFSVRLPRLATCDYSGDSMLTPII